MLYVAYGSNMNIEQMAYRCPNSKIIGIGKLVGWKLLFNFHADVIETRNNEDEVPVVIWDIDNKDWNVLDRYEGFPSYYTKKTVEVVTNNGTVNAVVYVMTNDNKGVCPPTTSYFNGIKDGYISNGIDLKCLYEALMQSGEGMV